MSPVFFLFALLASPFSSALGKWHKEGNQEAHKGAHKEGHEKHHESNNHSDEKNYDSVEWSDLPDWFRKAVGDEDTSGSFEEDPTDYVLKDFDSMTIFQSGSRSPPLVRCLEGLIVTFNSSDTMYVVPNPAHCTPSCDSEESCDAIVVTFYNATTPEVLKKLNLFVQPISAQYALTAAMPNNVTVYVDDMFYLNFEHNTLTSAGSAYPAAESV